MPITGVTFTILKVLFLGVVLWFFFLLLKRAMKMVPPEKKYRKNLERTFLLVKIAGWVVFGFSSMEMIFAGNSIYARVFSTLFLFLLIGISWSIIREFIAGIIIKLEGSYTLNGWIRINNVEGRIKRLRYRSIEIETEKGETVNIPYSLINREIRVKSHPIESIKSHTFEIEVPDTMEVKEYKDKIRHDLLNCHWSSLKKDPKIKLIQESNNAYKFRITAYTIDDHFFELIESFVKSKVAAREPDIVEVDPPDLPQ